MRRRLAPVLLVPVLLAGCSGSSSKPAALANHPDPTASTSVIPTIQPSAGGSTSSAVAAAPGSSRSADPARSSAAAGNVAGPVTTQAPGAAAATKATRPGTYPVDASGSISYGTPPQKRDASGSHNLVISPLSGDTQTSTTNSDQGGTNETLLVRDSGTYLADLKISSPAFTKEYRPATAVLFVPDPANVGTTWSYGGTTTDGKTTIQTTNKVIGTTTLTIGGKQVPCAVLTSHLVLSGDLSYVVDLTTWWSPAYRLPVKDHSVGKGSFSGIPFSTDITDVLRSVQPS